MGRYLRYLPNDEEPVVDADNGFLGMNSKIDRALLKEGLCASLVNKRLLRGVAETRPGMATPKAFNSVIESIYGAGIYSDPYGTEWVLLAVADGVYRCRWDRLPELIGTFDGERIEGPCEMIQCFEKVILFRGTDQIELEWDGTQQGLFRRIQQTTGMEGSGIYRIPNAETGVVYQNRLLLIINRDEIGNSDVLDYTRYDKVLEQFKINSGTDERLVAIFPFGQQTFLAFKEHSVWAVDNLTGDWSQNAVQEVLNDRVGCIARRSIAQVGGDVFFLDRTGVYRVQQVLQNRMQTAAIPVSDPIEPLINRINWSEAQGACAALWGQYYLLAVPLDDSAVNNVILRYNTVTENWEGYDEAAFPFAVDRFLVTDFQGQKRLLAVDLTHQRIYVLDEGTDDIVDGTSFPIVDLIETRGYTLAKPFDSKKFKDAQLALSTWNPCFTVQSITDGVNEMVTLMQDETKDRRKYVTYGKASYDTTNVNDDQLTPGRKDYSVIPNGVYCGSEGLRLSLAQEVIETPTLRCTGRWVSLRITNKQGKCDVRTVRVTGAGMRTTKENQ